MTADFDCCDQPKLLLRSQNQSGIEVDGLTHARSHPSPSGSDARSSVSHSTPTASVYNTRIISSQTLVEGSRASLDGSIHTTTTTLQQQQSNTSPFRYLARIWRWELLTWLLGTAGLLANITLLIWFNGVQQQYWNSSVQITAFVAALAQLSQSALLVPIASSIGQSKWKWLQKERKAIDIEKFDLASRGPDGALRLLWHLRLRPHLVSLGALSTIMMLAFPTFVQQSVAVNTRRAKFHTDSQTYVKRAGQVSVSNLESFSFNEDISNSVAMFQALVTEYINPANVTGHCATDICTWEPYTTLSICVTTEDISESLVHGDAISGDLASPPRLVGHDHAFSIEPGTTLYTYTQSVGDLYDHWPLPVDDIPTSLPDYPNLYLIFYDPCKKDVQDEQRPFDAQDITRWTAFRATFRPCVQIYNTTYASSWQSATMTSPESLQWYLTSSLSFCTRVPAFGDEICINSTLLRAIGESLRATYSFSGKRRAIVGASKPREGSEGSVIKVVENLGSNPPAWSTTLLQDIRSNLSNTDECNEEAFERFEHRVQNIAASVSIEIRNNGDSPGSIVVGTAWITRKQISHLSNA
ncbi:hypothetical protein G6011_11571 [Alternaria panax]|uniref:Uncharacterized protein n=1 Tax=Alternaria panax TaxID=48097 RepID=A0AAD4IDN4_9PLEO|nr:hypothetical protein G6011_11571 [Alternaria panax]